MHLQRVNGWLDFKSNKEIFNEETKKKHMYHKFYSFIDCKTNEKHNLITQLYKTAVCATMDNRPDVQFGTTPEHMVEIEEKLKKLENKGEIKQLTFGPAVTVVEDSNGFYKEL